MKKKPKIKLKGGAEWDALTRWRKWYVYLGKSGVAKSIKRQYNKRFRKYGKQDIILEQMSLCLSDEVRNAPKRDLESAENYYHAYQHFQGDLLNGWPEDGEPGQKLGKSRQAEPSRQGKSER
jgi:hypothetical protein